MSMIPEGLEVYGVWAGPIAGAAWFFGPSLNTVRKHLATWSDYQTQNFLKLGEKVKRRLDESETPNDDGSVHPRVIHEAFENASWIEDDLHLEYLAGLLVASRSADGKDDSGVYLTRLVASLTAAQVRLHHAIYSSYIGSRPSGEVGGRRFTRAQDLDRLTMSATVDSLLLVATNGASADSVTPLAHASAGLYREGLIRDMSPTPDEKRMQFVPTSLGAEVFGRAMYSPAVGSSAVRWSLTDLLKQQPPVHYVAPKFEYPPLAEVNVETINA